MKRGVSCLIYYFQVKVNIYIVSTNYERFIYLWTFEKSDFLYFEASEAQFTHVVPFAIAELGRKCLQPTATLKYEPLNSCITVLSV